MPKQFLLYSQASCNIVSFAEVSFRYEEIDFIVGERRWMWMFSSRSWSLAYHLPGHDAVDISSSEMMASQYIIICCKRVCWSAWYIKGVM